MNTNRLCFLGREVRVWHYLDTARSLRERRVRGVRGTCSILCWYICRCAQCTRTNEGIVCNGAAKNNQSRGVPQFIENKLRTTPSLQCHLREESKPSSYSLSDFRTFRDSTLVSFQEWYIVGSSRKVFWYPREWRHRSGRFDQIRLSIFQRSAEF